MYKFTDMQASAKQAVGMALPNGYETLLFVYPDLDPQHPAFCNKDPVIAIEVVVTPNDACPPFTHKLRLMGSYLAEPAFEREIFRSLMEAHRIQVTRNLLTT